MCAVAYGDSLGLRIVVGQYECIGTVRILEGGVSDTAGGVTGRSDTYSSRLHNRRHVADKVVVGVTDNFRIVCIVNIHCTVAGLARTV